MESSVDAGLRRRLESAQIDYCVIGATALATLGYVRATGDIDLLVLAPEVLSRAFWGDASVEILVGDPEDTLRGSVIWPSEIRHDVVVGKTWAARLALQTSTQNALLGCKVAQPLPLALMKLEAGSAQDIYDVIALIERRRLLGDIAWIDELPAHLPRLTPEGREAWSRMQLVLQR